MYLAKFTKKVLVVIVLLITITMSSEILARSIKSYNTDILPMQENVLDDTLLASNQFTQADDLSVVDNFIDVPNEYLLVAENNFYKLYMEEGSYAIRVVNKADGFIYGSSLSTKEENLKNFNTVWEGIVNSCITVSYYSYNDTTGVYVTKEESFLKDEASTSTYQLIENGFIASLTFGESGISMDLEVSLDGEYLNIEVPNESISETLFELKSIKVYPFLGAVYGNTVPGYILVPDGSGALIRYQDIDVFKDIYQFNYYGQDDSIQTNTSYEPVTSFPVSGMIHGINQHGFITIVEDGASEATLVVSPAKRNLKYYYTYNEFTFRSLYQTPLSESDSMNATGRLVVEELINDCNPVVKYKFLTGMDANYVGMASNYQEYLLENNLILDQIDSEDAVSIFLDVIAAETKSGFIFDDYIEMTDVEELIAILNALTENNINPLVVYKGYDDSGLTNSGIVYDGFNKKLGDVQDLIEYSESNDISLYFHINPMIGYSNSSFSVYKDTSKRINKNLNIYSGFTKQYYYMNPTSVLNAINQSVIDLEKLNIDNILIDSIGNLLYSDYSSEKISRSNYIDLLNEVLMEYDNQFLMYQANDYLLRYTDSYLLMPMTSSRYQIYTDTVPFTAYVLSGVMDKYSKYQNFSSDSIIELLKMVDYGVAPSYLVTDESAYALQKSELQQIYSSSYQTWESRILTDYQFVYEGLSSINNANVYSRTYLDSGVYMVSYDNGVDIYINYTNEDYNAFGRVIESLSYKVVTNHA